jgi:hypothetical protein
VIAPRTRALLVGAGLAAGSLTLAAPPASAADPALTVSATSGAGGTTISIDGTGCSPDANHDRVIRTVLRTGTAPAETFAGFAQGWDGEEALLTIPNWVDPDQPAVLEASCIEYSNTSEDPGPTVAFDFDPVPFDVLPGGGTAETATPTRTSVKVGQVLRIDVTGCAVDREADDSSYLDVLVFPGDDPTGRSFTETVSSMETGLGLGEDGTAWAYVAPARDEEGHPVPDGTYTAVVYCTASDGSIVSYAPFAFEVAGVAPTDDVGLSVAPGTSTVTLSGSGCTVGDVNVGMIAFPLDPGEGGPVSDALVGGPGGDHWASWRWGLDHRPSAAVSGPFTARWSGRNTTDRARRSDGEELPSLDTTVTPDGDGNWSVTWDAGIDHGDVVAFAQCGDPTGDGFAYQALNAFVDVRRPSETTPIVEPAKPIVRGATPVTGRPTFAG